jgi:integrase
MRVMLTDRFCARVHSEGQNDYFDERVPGLALRVGKRRRTWCLFYARRRITIGAYPAMSLAAARAAAIATKSGEPPSAPQSLAAIFSDYMTREGSALRTADDRRAVFDRHILPTLGARPIGEIKRSEIVALLDRMEDRSGPSAAHTVLAYLSKLFTWHATREDDFRSPIVRGMGRVRPGDRARDRTLTDAELRAIWAAPASPFNRYARFLLLTATRRNEAAYATRAEIDGDLWTIPAARYKTGVDHVVPLSRAAMAIIHPTSMLSNLGGSFYRADGPDRPLFGPRAFSRDKRVLDRATGVRGWRLHDLRRTARSLMSRAGAAPDVAERCLGHVIPGVRGVYDRWEYLEEKRAAFEALAGLVEGITRPSGI